MKNDLPKIFKNQKGKSYSAVLGLFDKFEDLESSGRIAIFTDTYCIDDYQIGIKKDNNCFSLIEFIIR